MEENLYDIDRLKEVWSANGRYYGYPNCCIQEFIKRYIEQYEHTEEQVSVANGTGFVPCIECTKKITDGEINLEGLIKNRKHFNEFPNDEMMYNPQDEYDYLFGGKKLNPVGYEIEKLNKMNRRQRRAYLKNKKK